MTDNVPSLRCIDDIKNLSKAELIQAREAFPLLDEINMFLTNSNKKNNHRSSGYYSPSSVPYCSRAMFYQRSQIPQNEITTPDFRIILDIGTAVHEVLQGYLNGALGTDCFKTEVKCLDDKLHLKGSADGLLDLEEGRWLLEIKSISPKGFESLAKPKSEHMEQALCYAYMLDAPMIWFLYYNKASGERRLFTELFDHRIWGKVTDKLERIEMCFQNATPPPKERGFGCNECKFSWHCKPSED